MKEIFKYDQLWRDLKGCFIEPNKNWVIRIFSYDFRIGTKKTKELFKFLEILNIKWAKVMMSASGFKFLLEI
jgi:hypothetical protein